MLLPLEFICSEENLGIKFCELLLYLLHVLFVVQILRLLDHPQGVKRTLEF
jgi:hypothetical protein